MVPLPSRDGTLHRESVGGAIVSKLRNGVCVEVVTKQTVQATYAGPKSVPFALTP